MTQTFNLGETVRLKGFHAKLARPGDEREEDPFARASPLATRQLCTAVRDG